MLSQASQKELTKLTSKGLERECACMDSWAWVCHLLGLCLCGTRLRRVGVPLLRCVGASESQGCVAGCLSGCGLGVAWASSNINKTKIKNKDFMTQYHFTLFMSVCGRHVATCNCCLSICSFCLSRCI